MHDHQFIRSVYDNFMEFWYALLSVENCYIVIQNIAIDIIVIMVILF